VELGCGCFDDFQILPKRDPLSREVGEEDRITADEAKRSNPAAVFDLS
jgi:hypothetical protein